MFCVWHIIQGIHKRMVRFQKLTRNVFLTLQGTTYTVNSGNCPNFSCATSSSFFMLSAGPRGQFPRWRRSRKRLSVCVSCDPGCTHWRIVINVWETWTVAASDGVCCKVRNKFLVNCRKSIILLCIPCIFIYIYIYIYIYISCTESASESGDMATAFFYF